MNSLQKFFIICSFLLAHYTVTSQCDGVISNIPILDGQDNTYDIIVAGANNNDLSDISQGVCEINIEFFHGAVSDLVFQLTSPSGQTVTLIGDLSSTGNLTTFSDWDVDFVQCSTEANPDNGIDTMWENSSGWTILGGYIGSYHPNNGCLEDFDSGPVNGTWQLRILDGAQFNEGSLLDFSIVFCDPLGIGCFQCDANAGRLTNNVLIKCTNEDLNFDFQLEGQNVNDEYAYVYMVSQNNTLIDIRTDSIMTGLAAGIYEVCGVSILKSELPSFLSTTLTYPEIISMINDGSIGLCIDISDVCTTIEIVQAPALIILDEQICAGEEYRLGDSILIADGSYAVTVNSTSTCDSNFLVNLEVVDINPVITASSANFTCSTTEITLDASQSSQEAFSNFTWSTEDGLLPNEVNDLTVQINYPGTYTLSQEENACSFNTEITIGLDSQIPDFAINSSPISCMNSRVEVNTTSGANIVSALWTGPNNFSSSEITAMVAIPGEYLVTYTDDTGCEFKGRHVVTQNSNVPVIELSAEDLSCENGNVVIQVASDSIFTSYSWTGPNGFTSDLPTPTVTAPGSYNLVAISAGGCMVQKSIEVFGDLQSFDYEVEGNTFLCNGGSTIISATSSIPGSFYVWTGPGNFTSSVASPSVTAEGTYYVDIIANGCVISDSVLVDRDISELPVYDIQIDTLGDCENPRFRFTAIPIENEQQVSLIRWGINGVGITATGSQIEVESVGNYFLYLNTFNGCAVVERFTLAPLQESPSANLLSKSNVTCATGLNGGTIQYEQNDDYSYQWTGPNAYTSDTSSLNNLQDGLYFLTLVDKMTGCRSFYEERIAADTIPRISTITSTEINCNNSSSTVRLSANGGGNTYFWQGPSDNFTTPTFNTSEAGQYFLTITGGNGCITLDTTEVFSDFSIPNLILVDSTLDCTSGAAPLTSIASDPGLIYSWSGPEGFMANAASPTVFVAGEYILSVTGLNGCSKMDTLEIFDNPDIPIPNLSASGVLNCIDTLVNLFGESNDVGTSFLWEGPDGFLSTSQNISISVPGTYHFRIEDDMNCIGRDSITIDEFIVLPERSFILDSIKCTNAFAELIADSPDDGAQFNWQGPNGFSQDGNIAMAIDTGRYVLQVRGSNNCVSTDSINLYAVPEDIQTSFSITCEYPTIDIDELAESITFDIEWTGPNGFSSTEISPAVLDNGTYSSTVQGSNGCTANITVEVVQDTISPTANAAAIGQVKCEETEIELNGLGSSEGMEFKYAWTTNNGNILSETDLLNVKVDGPGNYILSVIDTSNGCIDTMHIEVFTEPNDLTAIGVELFDPVCAGDQNGNIDIISVEGGTGPYSYSIDSFFFQSSPIFEGLSAGEYNVYVKDSFGCVFSNQIVLIDPEPIILELGENLDVFLGDEVTISANTNLTPEQIESIIWQISDQIGCADCLSFNLSPNQDIDIELSLMDASGCIIKDQLKVRVDQEPVLFKPNIFSPNEDGVNDIFYLSSNAGVAQIRSIYIFDRWGNKVFENFNFLPGDPTAGWDGTLGGNKLNAGAYIYKAEVEMITGLIRNVRGDVTLIK